MSGIIKYIDAEINRICLGDEEIVSIYKGDELIWRHDEEYVPGPITYEFVDMGLSVDWCTCNIGASKLEEFGYYFMWGDTTSYNNDRTPVGGGDPISFDWKNYKYCNGSSSSMIKYCTSSSYGSVDNKTVLDPEDDPVYIHIGDNCRMPTSDEYQELLDACDTAWVENYKGSGVNGRLFTLKSDSSKTLFFPAAGFFNNSTWFYENFRCYYWSCLLNNSVSNEGLEWYFGSDGYGVGSMSRHYGLPVRAVRPKPVCPVLFYNSELDELVIRNNKSEWRLDEEPIGIVVIPADHDVYGDGSCGIMSLMSASCDTPDTGSTTNQYICWGQYGINISELYDYEGCSSYGNQDNWTTVQYYSGIVYLPSDQSNFGDKLINKLPNSDQSCWYYNYTSHHSPSPYLGGGSRNPDYYNTEINPDNALSDFKGKENTEILISKAIAQSGWKTSSSLVNNSDEYERYSPAACTCWRYSTTGTKQGDWYLPAAGELGYIAVRYQKINNTIENLQSHFNKTFCLLDIDVFLSSSECYANNVKFINFGNGAVFTNKKNKNQYVRPFMKFKP